MAIGKFLAPLNGRMIQQQVEKPYVDDIFDPLFNSKVTEYYRGLYGPLGGIAAGYADMLDNALTGQKGILGPGMGILSTFGRSMDKADDFILGGVTEGVNLLGNVMGGTNETPSNPFKRIFVDDYDYQGTKLMAAAGNAMARLAGTQTPLDETDFQSLGDKIAGTALDLGFDPGIMGGQLARLNPNTPVGQVGQILSNYDDMVTNVAGNLAFPGGKALVGKSLTRIKDFIGHGSSAPLVDSVIWTSKDTAEKELNDILNKGYTTGSVSNKTPNSPIYNTTLRDIAEDYAVKADLTPLDPEYSILEEIREKAPAYYDEKATRIITEDDVASPSEVFVYKQSQKHKDYLEKTKAQRDALAKEIEEGHLKYIEGVKDDINNFTKNESKYLDNSPTVAQEYMLDDFDSPYYDADILEDEFKEQAKVFKKQRDKSWVLSHNQINRINADKKLQYLQNYIEELKAFDRRIFDVTYLKHAFPNAKNMDYSILNKLMSDGNVGDIYYKGKQSSITHEKYRNLMNELHDKFIPFVRENERLLSTNKTGQRLIKFADDIDDVLFKFPETTTYKVKELIPAESYLLNGDPVFKHYATKYTPGAGMEKYSYFKYENGKIVPNELVPDIIQESIPTGKFITETVTNRIPITKAYSPRLQNLEAMTKTEDINTFDEFLRLKEKYPHITLMLKENKQGFYTMKKTLKGKELENYFKKNFKYLTNKDAALIKELPISKKLTTMDDVYANMPKNYKNILPKKQSDLYKDIITAVKDPKSPYTNLVGSSKHLNEFVPKVSKLNPENFAITITNPKSIQEMTSVNLLDDVFKTFKADWGIDPTPEKLEWYVKKFGTRQEKTLFQMIKAASQSKINNKLKTRHGVYNLDSVKQTKVLFDSIEDSKIYNNKMGEYISRNDLIEGAKISGDSFLESIFASGCFKEIPIDPKYTSDAQVDEIIKQLNKNVETINKNGNILKVIDVPADKDFPRIIAVAFDTDNLNVKKDVNKIYGLFGKKNLELQDVMLRNPTKTETSWDTSELDSAFKELRNTSEELSKTLGYTNFSPNYISHAMEDSETSAEIFNAIYKRLGLDKAKLDQLHDALLQQDVASSSRLSLGASAIERAHLGYFGQYSKIVDGKTIYGFSTDLKKIHASTFTQGMFDNTNAQTFFDLFLTDNFKIKNNFDSVASLKKALHLSEGNLNNLSIVKPKYNENRKLVGFTRLDKFSDASLEAAFKDSETVLLPDSVIGSLDRICKKDARMSSKVYRFINKYLTVPFKFGTLANPGFLAGNIQDAYFKQAVELSKKYGTSLSEEFTNVAMSMRNVVQLNNEFSKVFDGYVKWLKDTDLTKITRNDRPASWYLDTFKKSKNSVETLTIDQIVNNPELYKSFKEYLDAHVTKQESRVANLYLYINNNQTTSMFKNNNRDLEDLTNLINSNPYNTPNNIIERIMYGNPSKTKIVKIKDSYKEVQDTGFRSYGLFLNNPVSNGIIKSSNTIENLMRSATILNDLQHKGYTMDDICDILALDKVSETAIRSKFAIDMQEAINTMYAANFDYDNVSEFMNKLSYILPFPTFYLKNLAFWADIFTNKPQLIDNVISVHEGLWAGKDTSDEFTAEAKGRGAVPVGQNDKHLTGIVKQTPYNSMFGAFNAVNDIQKDFAYRTNPILRPVARHLQDPEDVRYRPYNMNQYQKNIKKGDKEFSELSYMFHQLNPYERTVNTALRTPGKVANNSWQLSDFLPSIFQPDFRKK